MHKYALIFFMVPFLLSFQGCGAASADGGTQPLGITEEEYVELHTGDCCSFQIGLNMQTRRVFTSQSDYESEALLYGHSPETIDFSKYSVLFLHMGERTTTGYSIDVTGVDRFSVSGAPAYEREYIVVKIENTIPTQDCITGDQITTPHLFIKIKSVPNVLVEETIVARCGS